MPLRFEHIVRLDPETRAFVAALTKELKHMSEEIARLTAAVTANTTVTESAIVLLQGLKTRLDEAIASDDMSEVQALADSLSAETQRLAEAVTANTPAEETPV